MSPGRAAAANATVTVATICPDDGGAFPVACTKELRIYNNTARTLWPVIQAGKQLTDALNCTLAGKGGGDVWLQAALGKTDDCFAVHHDYYAFVNPSAGILKGGFVSIKLPWWSKRAGKADDTYVDWWRGGRVILFDDKTAFQELYDGQNTKPQVLFAASSPKPRCNTAMDGNGCSVIQIFQVLKPVDPHLPFQLNEYTFANVKKVIDNGTKGGDFIDFNQGYNVSNVDQIYLPLAMEPVRDPANVGYMGTVMNVAQFRKQLNNFANGGDTWPVYNNPIVKGAKMYPNAGVRVPAAQSVFAFYMNPQLFPDGQTPAILPDKPPQLVQSMLNQWTDCTSDSPKTCAQDDGYKLVDSIFKANYKVYAKNCDQIPNYLKPVGTTGLPKLTAYLFFVYGWVPFNVACPNPELPVASDLPPGSHGIIDYNGMQYNYQTLQKYKPQWFNPYTQLIHDAVADGGLDSSSYAFSIDDHASYLNNSGVNVPGGLIFAVGGPKGLVNGTPHAPPLPEPFQWYDFSIGLGTPGKTDAYWTKYGICSQTADVPFAAENYGTGPVIGVSPTAQKIDASHPCPLTFEDSKGRKYQVVVLKAQIPGTTLPQKAIWPAHEVKPPDFFDKTVVSCPTKPGFVQPADWCNSTNQVSRPQSGTTPGFYTLGLPPPVKG
ncbi:MAG TPA: hypothetical protein VL899_04755 [Alphaproteobacteria bacterium]|nr:hypothetical protein [Alphaproteobacteria bacterium]